LWTWWRADQEFRSIRACRFEELFYESGKIQLGSVIRILRVRIDTYGHFCDRHNRDRVLTVC